MSQYITSPQNTLVKKLQKMNTSSSARKKDGRAILDGAHLVREILNTENQNLVEHIFFTENITEESWKILEKFPESTHIEVSEVVMQKIAPTKTPSGILALIKKPAEKTLGAEKFIILLDRVSDPGNMGTIIRTGVSFGVEAFILSPGCADAWSSKALRASQGAHFYTKIIENFALTEIKEVFDGKIYGTFLDASARSLYDTDLTGAVALCVGNEGSGISPDLDELFDKKIYIPMQNNFESLNVAIATAICCAEKSRQC